MRVAWQAGVIRALDEAGYGFAHADGTSGGIINLAMLLSGISAPEMCARWASLDVKDFASLLPPSEYLQSPTKWMAVGDADGLVHKVFPHLGIDVDHIRGVSSPEGTFNVCNFTTKTCEAISHRDVDVDFLVAGVSLPIFMPPVVKGAVTYTDAVWIKDANLMEGVRRGSDELWVAWCIGNTGSYGAGPLEQYVHMIEMSANGALFAELEQIAEINRRRAKGEALYGHSQPVRVHVVVPEYPLPLDPEFFLGGIDAHTLVAMGYRDAKAYLAAMSPEGVALDHRATRMKNPPLGFRFRERMRGRVSFGTEDHDATVDAVVEVHDAERFFEDPAAGASVVGSIGTSTWRYPVFFSGGTFRVVASPGAGSEVRYEVRFDLDGDELTLRAVKRLHDDPGFDLFGDVTTAHVTVLKGDVEVGSGELRLGAGDLRRLLTSIRPSGAHGVVDRAGLVAKVGKTLLGDLWRSYT
jgi:hypothetical protein